MAQRRTPPSARPSKPKKNHRMARCTRDEIAQVTRAIDDLPPRQRGQARRFVETITPKGLCEVMHAMRRWYSNQTGPIAARILKHREALGLIMRLDPPLGSFRGFKVDASSALARREEGDEVRLTVSRNGACSSWSTDRKAVDRFSGAGKGKVGVVVELIDDGDQVKAFIAPPSHTAAWFNAVYERVIGTAFRGTESEFAVHAKRLRVRLVRLKRR